MFDPTRLKDMISGAKEMGDKLQQAMDSIAVEASSGGGMVTARMNGKHQLLSLKIDPSVVNPADIEMLQDLVRAAVNEASRKADDALKEKIPGMMGGLLPPGIN